MKQKADAILEGYEDRQLTTEETLARLESLIQRTVEQKKEQAEKQFDDITYFVYLLLIEKNFKNPETIARSIKRAFAYNSHWKESENDLRELRQQVMFSIMNSDDKASDEDIIRFVETFFSYLFKAFNL